MGGDAPVGSGNPAKPPDGGLRRRLLGWRDDVVKVLIVGLPILLIQQLYQVIAKRVFEQPWQALWFLGPLAGAAWVSWQVVVRGRQQLLLRRPMLIFLGIYVLVFSIAAQGNLLDWRRDTVGAGGPAPPRSWLFPAAWGDWRYRVARCEPARNLLVITTKPSTSLESGRHQVLNLLAAAEDNAASGIAFDFHFRAQPTRLDSVLCSRILQARDKLVVVFGCRMEPGATDRWRPAPMPPALGECLPDDQRGHIMVVRDADHRVRLLPAALGPRELPALAVRAAARLEDAPGAEPDLPTDGYVQPVPPCADHSHLSYAQLEEMDAGELREELQGLFLLVGEESGDERFETPFGERLGVMIHADAIHSLRQGAYFRSTPWWLTSGLILFLCYFLTALAVGGAGAAALTRVALGASAALFVVAALAARVAWLWIDVVYGLAAIWPLLLLLLLRRRARAGAA